MALRRVLILGGVSANPLLTDLVEELGMVPCAVQGPTALHGAGVDVVCGTVDGHSPPGDAVDDFVSEGGGLVSLGACDGGDGDWRRLLGVAMSSGPGPGDTAAPPAPTSTSTSTSGEMVLSAEDHPLVRRLARRSGRRATVTSVVLDRAASAVVLGRVDGVAVLWTVARGEGRVVHHGGVTSDEMLHDPWHRTIVGRALRWVGETS